MSEPTKQFLVCFVFLKGEATTSSARRDSELDKMTIVVATAGSTLGALIVLLTALVCFRRFHRGRRFRRYSLRSRRYSDDDRIAIIAAYSGDVHFILPSYDEAISQVERSPPPFESVVEGAQGSDNERPPSSSNASTSQAANVETISPPENANSTEPVGDSTSIREHDTTAEQQPIHIVSNPLADTASDARSHAPNETLQTANAANETGGTCNLALNSSDESIDTGDVELWPNRPPDSLPSSSSEDDLTSSQTQPLLGSESRGVMV